MALTCSSLANTWKIKTGCIKYSDDDFATSYELPNFVNRRLLNRIEEATEERYHNTSGLFVPIDEDEREVDWELIGRLPEDHPLDCWVRHGECWLFRYYPSCAGSAYDELLGQVSLNTDEDWDNNNRDPQTYQFLVKGLAEMTRSGYGACPDGASVSAPLPDAPYDDPNTP